MRAIIMKLALWSFFILNGFHLPVQAAKLTESPLQRVDLRLCGKDHSRCLLISAPDGELSQLQNTMNLNQPTVHGLGFEKKQISSAIVDLTTGIILLREHQKNIYLGEWTINLDTLKVSFYAVPQ